jgi:hypothetical protein
VSCCASPISGVVGPARWGPDGSMLAVSTLMECTCGVIPGVPDGVTWAGRSVGGAWHRSHSVQSTVRDTGASAVWDAHRRRRSLPMGHADWVMGLHLMSGKHLASTSLMGRSRLDGLNGELVVSAPWPDTARATYNPPRVRDERSATVPRPGTRPRGTATTLRATSRTKLQRLSVMDACDRQRMVRRSWERG